MGGGVGKPGTGGMPGVDLVERWAAAEQVEPFGIGDADKGGHDLSGVGGWRGGFVVGEAGLGEVVAPGGHELQVVGVGRNLGGGDRRLGFFGCGEGGDDRRRGNEVGFLRNRDGFADGRNDDFSPAARTMEVLSDRGPSGEEGFAALGAFKEDVADGDGDFVGAVGAGERDADVVFIGAEMEAAMFADE